jgi:cyclic pyranopterin phosphate synthase
VSELPHLSDSGDVHMVDVSGKEVSVREAVAEALVEMSSSTARLLFAGELPKGDALATVRLAGIMAAKRTAELIPLCHPLPLEAVSVLVEQHPMGARIVARVKTVGRTGVEMEAMTAAAVAGLALYDMVKGVERGVSLGPVRLLEKQGGRSGHWTRD